MRKLLSAAAFLVAGLIGPAYGQSQVIPLTGSPPAPVSPTNPLPVVSNSIAGAGATHAQCAALCANLVVDGAPGNLFSFEVAADSTLSGAAWWIMIYDATAAPADGSVTPAKCYAMPSGVTNFNAAFATGGVAFATGITMGVSTTGCFTKTASTHAFIAGDFH